MKKRGKLFVVSLISLSISLQFFVATQQNSAYGANEPGISSTEIKLGSTYPMSGPAGIFFHDFSVGANAYFEHLNANGGIFGRKVTVIYKNDESIPTMSISKTNELIFNDKVFALFNSAPTSATHVAMSQSVGIARRGIPDIAVTAPYSGFADIAKYPTTFAFAPNARQEAKALLSYFSNNFKNTPLNIVYENSDLGADFLPIWQSSGVVVGAVRPYTVTPQDEIAFRTDNSGVLNFGGPYGVGNASTRTVNVSSNQYPLFVRGASLHLLSVNPNLNNIYANFYLPQLDDVNDPFVAFYLELFSKYVPSKTVTQQMIEGANSAYVVSQALAGIGNSPTRKKLIEFFRNNSKSISSATYSPLDFSGGNSSGGIVQYIAKFNGAKWIRTSEYFFVDSKGLSLSATEVRRLPLLPNGLPRMQEIASSNRLTITCVKGKLTKKVTTVNPKCPKGYKKK